MAGIPTESLTVAELVDRFRGDAYLAHQWVTGAATDMVTTADGVQYPTLAKIVADNEAKLAATVSAGYVAGTVNPTTALSEISPTAVSSVSDGALLWQTPAIVPTKVGARFVVEFAAQIDIDAPSASEATNLPHSLTLVLFAGDTLIGVVTEYFATPQVPKSLTVRAMVPEVQTLDPLTITCRIGTTNAGAWYVGCLSTMDQQAPQNSPHSDSVWSVREIA